MSLPTAAHMADDAPSVRADELERIAAYHDHMADLTDGDLAPYIVTVHRTTAMTLRSRADSYRRREA